MAAVRVNEEDEAVVEPPALSSSLVSITFNIILSEDRAALSA